MSWHHSRQFAGGIVLPEQQRPLRVPRIEPLAAGDRLRVPLRHPPGGAAQPAVRAGQSVRALELLGRAGEPALCTYAPVCGKVTAVGRVLTTSGRTYLAVELAVSPDRAAAVDSPHRPPQKPQDPTGWSRLCDRFGLINTPDGAPLSDMFRRVHDRPVDHLIIRALGTEPVETAAAAILLEQGSSLIEGAERLAEALGARRTWIALSRRLRQGRRLLSRITRQSPVTAAVLPDRYPQANVHLLVRSVCGRVVPVGDHPQRHGVCVVGVATVADLANALLHGLPATSCVITVTGDAVTRPADYRIPTGLAVGELLERVGTTKPTGAVIAGGPLAGRSLPHADVIVDSTTSCLTVLGSRAGRRPGPEACLRCGWCLDECPVGLDPATLMNLAEQFAYDRAVSRHPEACLECGICAYMCPAHLDLARAARQLKRASLGAAEGPV